MTRLAVYRDGRVRRSAYLMTDSELQGERLDRRMEACEHDPVRALRGIEAALAECEALADDARSKGLHGPAVGWDETAAMLRVDALALVARHA